MVRRRRHSSITHPRPVSYHVSKDAALRVISSHLDKLLDKKNLIQKRVEMEGESAVYDEMCKQEVIINHINLLNKVIDKISSTESLPLSVVAEQLEDVHQKRALISQAEDCLCLGISLLTRQQKILLSKPEVIHQIDMLEKIFKEISAVQLPLTGGHRGTEVEEYQLPPLMTRLRKYRGFAEICEYRDFSTRTGYVSLLPLGLRGILSFNSARVSPAGECAVKSARIPFWRCKAARNLKFRLSMNEMEKKEAINQVNSESLNKQRYLCVTNGFEIFCLDLKQRKDQTFSIADDVPPLPKIATLNLSKERLPVASMGLFKWRSSAYIFCGKFVNSMLDDAHDPSNIYYSHALQKNVYYSVMGKWGYLLEKLYKEGSTCDINLFSLADDGFTISYSEFNISKPNKPKFWPTVEIIDGQIHLIDSLPKDVENVCNVWRFSHEIFDPDSGTWIEITSSNESLLYITRHLVVGHFIFAISPMDLYSENCSERSYLVFDSKTNKWSSNQRHRVLYSIKEVWDILELGHARCAGEFLYGEPCEPLYVIIALQPDRTNDKYGTWAVAYLVTFTGQVLCIQVLRHFFAGPVWPCYMLDGKLIEVEGRSATMCSIVVASAWDRWADTSLEYVFIHTFTVEKLTHAASQIRQLWAKGSKSWPVEQDFVRVDIKDKCIYKKNDGLEEEDADRWVGVQACFL